MAFGSASSTVAVTSIASSFAMRLLGPQPLPRSLMSIDAKIGLKTRQDVRPIAGDSNHVFKMRRQLTVHRDRRPVVAQDPHRRTTGIHHGFDGKNHALFQRRSVARLPE